MRVLGAYYQEKKGNWDRHVQIENGNEKQKVRLGYPKSFFTEDLGFLVLRTVALQRCRLRVLRFRLPTAANDGRCWTEHNPPRTNGM